MWGEAGGDYVVKKSREVGRWVEGCGIEKALFFLGWGVQTTLTRREVGCQQICVSISREDIGSTTIGTWLFRDTQHRVLGGARKCLWNERVNEKASHCPEEEL